MCQTHPSLELHNQSCNKYFWIDDFLKKVKFLAKLQPIYSNWLGVAAFQKQFMKYHEPVNKLITTLFVEQPDYTGSVKIKYCHWLYLALERGGPAWMLSGSGLYKEKARGPVD